MRISDWSSDVCSSDLSIWTGEGQDDVSGGALAVGSDSLATVVNTADATGVNHASAGSDRIDTGDGTDVMAGDALATQAGSTAAVSNLATGEIGRASCRERVCQYV